MSSPIIEPDDQALPSEAVFHKFCTPRFQASMWGVPPLYQWQRDVFDELVRPGAAVCLSTPNEAGKSSVLVPLLGLSVMTAFPGATVFSTAGAEEQIEGQLFKYLTAMCRPYERYGWKVSTSALTVKAPPIHGLQSRWIGRVPRDALTMEGYHGQKQQNELGTWVYSPICLIVDEAKALGLDVLEACIRINPDWLLMVSTPGKDEGMFYDSIDPDTLGPDRIAHGEEEITGNIFTYRRIIGWDECPHLQEGKNLRKRQQVIAKYGEHSSFVKSFLYGQFASDDDENRVFSEVDIIHLKKCMKKETKDGAERKVAHGTMKAAIDVSGGGDEQVLAIRCGAEVVYWDQETTSDTMDLAKRWAATLKEFGVAPTNCCGDSGGGYGEILKMIESFDYFGIQRYGNNQEPRNSREYGNRITEDTYEFKALCRTTDIILPDDSKVIQQARRRLFKFSDSSRSINKVTLEKKEAHRARHRKQSPDRLETLVMLFSGYLAPRIKEDPEYVSPLEKRAQERGGTRSFAGLRKQPSLRDMVR